MGAFVSQGPAPSEGSIASPPLGGPSASAKSGGCL